MVSLFSVIVAITSILSVAMFLAILFRKRLLETIFLSSGLIILVLFCFGLLGFRGCLLVGYWAVISLSLAAAIFSMCAMYARRVLMCEIDLWRGLAVIGVFSAFSLFLNYNRWFISWDEFSHWGIIVKHMYYVDAFGSISGLKLLYPDYFPGISLFEYFFTRANATFVEYPVFVASNFLFFAMAVTFIKKIDVRSAVSIVAFMFFPLAIAFSSSIAFFSNILVDILMGCLFGFSAVVYLRYWHNGKDIFGLILLSTALAVLAITKDTGIVLALIVLAAGTLDVLLHKRKELDWSMVRGNRRKMIRRPVLSFVPLLSVIIPWLLYKLNLKLFGVQPSWQEIDVESIFMGQLKDYQLTVLHDFWRNFFTVSDPPIPIPPFWLMVVFLGISILWSIVLKNRETAKRVITLGIALFIGLFIYGALIMSLYMLIFSEYEAARLASYERYIGTYLTGFSLFVVGIFLFETRFIARIYKKHTNMITLLLFFGAVALGGAICWSASNGRILYDVMHARQEVATTIMAREPYEVAKQWRPCLGDQNDKLSIITTNTKGNERNILLYTLYPIAVQTYYRRDFSVAERPYDNGDVWTLVVSPQGWSEYMVKNYTLVYVFQYDENFKQSYGRYFDELRNNQLYQVEGAGNNIRLSGIGRDGCSVAKQ